MQNKQKSKVVLCNPFLVRHFFAYPNCEWTLINDSRLVWIEFWWDIFFPNVT